MNKGMAVRWMMLFSLWFLPFLMVMAAPFVSFAAQGPQTFTLDGRIKQAGTTTPILDPSIKIEVHVMDPSRNCVLYAEEQFVNTQSSNGYFNIQVGSNIGAGKRIAGVDPGLAMATVFQNSTPMSGTNVSGNTCPAGTYTPLARDTRYFRIFVTPSSTAVTDQLTDIVLDAVPTAMVAETADKVGAFGPADLLRVNTGGSQVLSQANLETVFTSSNYAVLTALLAGTSNLYNKPASNGTNVLPTIAAPTSPSAGQIWYNAGNVYFHDGSVTRTISTGSSTAVSAADGTAAAPSIGFASDANTGWYLAAPDNLAAATGGAERVRINENGNLGVGSSSPGARLTLGGDMSAASWQAGGIGIRQNSANYTDTSSSGTVGFNYVNAFGVPTLIASSATTYTNGSSFSLYPPVPGTNVTLTNSTALTINTQSLSGGGGVTNGYGMQVNAPTGATNNYAAAFMGGNVGIGTTAPQAKLVINANTVAPTTPNAGSHLQVSGADNSGSSITLDAYGANFYDSPYFTMRKARGTAASPSSTLNNDILGDVQMQGYFSGFTTGAEVVGVASESWTGTAQGTKIQISTNRKGTTTRTVSTFGDYGLAVGSSNPAASSLEVNGSYSVPSWTTTGQNFAVKAATSTDTTGSGAIATRVSSSFAAPTFASSSAVTVGDAATVYIAGAPIQGANTTITRSNALYVAAGQSYFGGNVGIGTTAPTAKLHLPAGTAAAGTAPLKLTAGPVNTAPEAGAIEFDGTSLFYTDSGNVRRTLGVAGAGITALTGEVTASGTGSVAATIANDAVTFAKMQNIATQRLLGRSTAAAGDVEELTVGTGLTITGGALNLTDTTDDDSFATLLGVCGNGFMPLKAGGVWTCVEASSTLSNDTIVRRGATGSFEGNQMTANSLRLNNSGSYVSINTPMAANYSLTLPTDDGTTAGQVLTTDGSGVLTWTTPATGSGDFKADGTVPMTGVLRAIPGTAALPGYAFVGDVDTGLSAQTADTLVLSTAGSERVRVDSSGNVGIGTTNPTSALEVNGAIRVANGSAAAPSLSFSNTTNTGLYSASAGNLNISLGGSTRIAMDSSNFYGNVTAAPHMKIDGTSTAAAPVYTFTGDSNLGMFRAGADILAFTNNGSETVRIDATGNVGIGTTSPNAGGTSSNANRVYLNIKGSAGSGILQLSSGEADGNNQQGSIEWVDSFTASADKRIGYINMYKNSATANNRGTYMAFATKADNGSGAAERMRLTQDGNVCVGCVSNTTNRIEVKGSTSDSTAGALYLKNSTDAALLYVRNDSNVGIGTTSPTVKLDVAGTMKIGNGSELCPAVGAGGLRYNSGAIEFCNGASWATLGGGGSGDFKADGSVAMTGAHRSIAGTAALPGMTFTGDVDTGLSAQTADTLVASTAGNERLRIDSSGNVGVGTTNPTAKLDVTANGSAVVGRFTQNAAWNPGTGNYALSVVGYTNLNGFRVNGADSQNSFYATGTDVGFTIDSGYAITFGHWNGATKVESFRSASNGNVGIGATNPSVKLEVGGTVKIGNGGELCPAVGAGGLRYNSGALEICDGAAWTALGTGGGSSQWTTTGSDIYYNTGRVGIGTSVPRAKLDVNGVIASAAAVDRTLASTIDFSAGNIQYTTDNCQAFQLNHLKDGATYTFVVKGTSSATCSFTTYSDAGSTALTPHLPPGHAATTAGKHTLYSLMVVGGDVYFAWIPGY